MGIIQRLCGAFATALVASSAFATAPPGCTSSDAPDVQRVIYMNGVQVETSDEALLSAGRIAEILSVGDPSTGEPGSPRHQNAKKKFCFSVAYNPIGWGDFEKTDGKMGPHSGFQDVYEVLFLKHAEEFFASALATLRFNHSQSKAVDLSAAKQVSDYLHDNKLASLDNGFTREYANLVSLHNPVGGDLQRLVDAYNTAAADERVKYTAYQNALARCNANPLCLPVFDDDVNSTSEAYQGGLSGLGGASKVRRDALRDILAYVDGVRRTFRQKGTLMGSRLDELCGAEVITPCGRSIFFTPPIEGDAPGVELVNMDSINALVAYSTPVDVATTLWPTVKAGSDLATTLKDPRQTVVVAHSQGNLIAQMAYALAAVELGDSQFNKRVRIVNIANTSQVSFNDLGLTNDDDGVINALKSKTAALVTEPFLSFTRNSTSCVNTVCVFKVADSTLGAPTDDPIGSIADEVLRSIRVNSLSGLLYKTAAQMTIELANSANNHLLVETYLSNRTTCTIDGQSCTMRFKDYFEDTVYTASLALDTANAPQAPEWNVVFRDDFDGVRSPYWGVAAGYNIQQAYSLQIGGTSGSSNRLTLNRTFVADGPNGPGKIRIKWRQWATHGTGSNFRVMFDASQSAGFKFATVSPLGTYSPVCKGYSCATNDGSTYYRINREWNSVLRAFIEVTVIIDPSMATVEYRSEDGRVDKISVPGRYYTALQNPFFFVTGNDNQTTLAIDYFEVAMMIP